MYWEKLRAFLIVLFSAINIFLIVSMLTSLNTYTTIKYETVSDVVSILSENNIKIDQSLIPISVKNMDNMEVANVIYTEKFKSSQKNNFTTDENIFSFDVVYDNQSINEKNYKKVIKSLLKEHGFDARSIQFDSYTEKNGIKKISCSLLKNDTQIYNMHLDITLQDDIINIKGAWFNFSSYIKSQGSDDEILHITSVLIEFANDPELDKTQGVEIKNIQLGYYAFNTNTKSKTVTAVPCWKIILNDGRAFYYNAKTAAKIQ